MVLLYDLCTFIKLEYLSLSCFDYFRISFEFSTARKYCKVGVANWQTRQSAAVRGISGHDEFVVNLCKKVSAAPAQWVLASEQVA